MKTQYIILLALILAASCKKEGVVIYDFNNYTVDKVVCQAQSNYLIADNESELNLEVKLYSKTGEYTDIFGNIQHVYKEIPQSRWRKHEIKFFNSGGTEVSAKFKTGDASPGKLKFYAEVDGVRSSKPILQLESEFPREGTAIEQEPEPTFFEVNLREPLALTVRKKIPVIFHVVDSKSNSAAGQVVKSDAIYYVIDLWNNVFGERNTALSNSATPNIEFVPAKINLQGKKLEEPGINRVYLDEAQEANLKSQKQAYVWNNRAALYWDCDRYLNIWIFYSEVTMATTDLLKKSYPTVFADGVYDPEHLPLPSLIAADLQHLSEEEMSAWKINPGGSTNTGALEKAGIVFTKNGFATRSIDFVKLMGVYLGVIPNSPFSDDSQRYYGTTAAQKVYMDDQCDDTPVYDIWFWGSATKGGKESAEYGSPRIKYMRHAPWIIYSSTNISDNYSSQSSITQDQVKRINWILENATGRQMWKNDYAIK